MKTVQDVYLPTTKHEFITVVHVLHALLMFSGFLYRIVLRPLHTNLSKSGFLSYHVGYCGRLVYLECLKTFDVVLSLLVRAEDMWVRIPASHTNWKMSATPF